jgi:hypothetical protein
MNKIQVDIFLCTLRHVQVSSALWLSVQFAVCSWVSCVLLNGSFSPTTVVLNNRHQSGLIMPRLSIKPLCMIFPFFCEVYCTIIRHRHYRSDSSWTVQSPSNFHTCKINGIIHKEKSNKMPQCIKILLFYIYMKLNMFRATPRPSSGT